MNDSARAGDTAERLLAATWQVIRDEGLRAATSRRISEAAGANLAAIGYHFGSKRDLVAKAVEAQMRDWTEPMAASLLSDEADGGDRTRPLIGSLLGVLEGSQDEAQAFLEAVVARDVDDRVRETLRAHLIAFQQLVAGMLSRRAAVTAKDAPDALAGLFTALALGLITQEAVGANPAPLSDIVDEFLHLLDARSAD